MTLKEMVSKYISSTERAHFLHRHEDFNSFFTICSVVLPPDLVQILLQFQSFSRVLATFVVTTCLTLVSVLLLNKRCIEV